MDNLFYLVTAYAVLWIVLFGYVLNLVKKQKTLSTLYRIPFVILYSLERPKININIHPVFAFEFLWHSPRVPATSTPSTISEFARFKHVSRLIDNFHTCSGKSPIVFSYEFLILLPRPAENIELYLDHRIPFLDFRYNLQRRAKP